MDPSLRTPDPQQYDAYPPPPKSATSPFTIAGLVCGLLALVFAPIVLGPLGAVFGFVGYSKGDRRGLWVGIGSIVTTIVGIAIGLAALHAVKR